MSDSPVSNLLQQLIYIDRKSVKAIYMQITEQIATAVNNGLLTDQTKLPGTRQLSESIKVHRKTVVAAYEELAGQGIVSLIPNKGTFVNRKNNAGFIAVSEKWKISFISEKSVVEIPVNRILEMSNTTDRKGILLDDGLPDSSMFQLAHLGIGLPPILNHLKQENVFLPYQIQQYVIENLHIKLQEAQLAITSNRSLALYLITQVLLRPSDIAVVGLPGNYIANMLIQQVGGVVKTVKITKDGWDLDQLEDLCKKGKVRLLYLSPSHQYPTGYMMEYAQRLAVLQLAKRYGFFIIEDDTAILFSYQKWKLPHLISLDEAGSVLHISSFEQLMPMEYNIAFISGPENIIAEIRKYQSAIGLNNTESIQKKVMAAALQSGGIARLHKKNTRIYSKRMEQSAALLNQEWGQYVQFDLPKNGLAFWLQFDWNFNLNRFADRCKKADLNIPAFLLFQSKDQTAMRLGYAKWKEEEWEKIIAIGIKILIHQ